jgi:hypothetical protein
LRIFFKNQVAHVGPLVALTTLPHPRTPHPTLPRKALVSTSDR